MGVDEVRFKTAQVYDYTNDPNKLIPATDKYSRYSKNKQGDYQVKNAYPIIAGAYGMQR